MIVEAASAVAASIRNAPVASVLEALKAVSTGSSTMMSWSLAIVAGSIAAIVGTSYLRPSDERVRLIYLLYLPGWALLGTSMYYGNEVARRAIAAHMVSRAYLPGIAQRINDDFSAQRVLFAYALLAFGAWLVCFLLWWIFGAWTTSSRGGKNGTVDPVFGDHDTGVAADRGRGAAKE